MDHKNSEHIEDAFLKKLLAQVEEEKPTEGFTGRVMDQLPKTQITRGDEKSGVSIWQWIVMGIAVVGAAYFIFTFDIGTFVGSVEQGNQSPGINYLNMFSAIVKVFSEGFSGFHVTSISLMIVASGVLLFIVDRVLKKWSNHHHHTHFA